MTYTYTCEAYISAFYMVRLWSVPRHHGDERQQHAIVSINPHFYGTYNINDLNQEIIEMLVLSRLANSNYRHKHIRKNDYRQLG